MVIKDILNKIKEALEELKLYWNQPRPGEYVPYKEVIMLSVGWMALLMSVQWTIGFGVGNQFTGMTLGMNNNQLLVMGYICQAIGYVTTPLNAWIVDNLRSKDGKYRVYIKLAIPSMVLTLLSLWLPYEQVRDAHQPFTQYIMIAMLFVMGQVQGYVQSWVQTGVTNMVHVMTPNTQERTKIMAITSIIYSLGYSINNIYFPLMVDVLSDNGDKYNMTYFRGSYTPVALLMPLVLLAYFGTKERLVLPKSRITKMSFTSSLRAVAGNKIFWIKCADGWNNFLEGAKGNIWDWLVYRAHIMKSTTYGVLNTISYNANFWGMLFSPWFIKKFGKKKIKIFKNIVQIFLIASYFLFYKSPLAGVGLFIVYTLDRFVDTYNVIDSAIESDMRDNQQYLIGERIDGAFGFVSTYAGGAINAVTSLFVPWIYKKKGFDGNDYSVLDVYVNYDERLPLSKQTKNPNCVLYSLMDTLLVVSIIGAAIDVLPWFLYDISETGQKSMIRAIRIRTLVEDNGTENLDDGAYIEGCEAVFKAKKYYGLEKDATTKDILKQAKALPSTTEAEKELRSQAIKNAKERLAKAEEHNEEVEIADFVIHELTRFENDFGKKQIELCRLIVSGGPQNFYQCAEEAQRLAIELPISEIKEERTWRKQEIRNAKALLKSEKLARKYYPDGIIPFDNQDYEDAYNLPDGTREEAKLRRKLMRKLSKERDRYGVVAAPYLSAKRTLDLYEGYKNIDEITADYETVVNNRNERLEKERKEQERLEQERKNDRKGKEASRRLRK
ncbi:MAG: MFS transporter [Clostridia bacterium]|nr:MFS transporter [Clostridia bacterium]MBP3559221.1 MFS transporter [Clostridia bacterium]